MSYLILRTIVDNILAMTLQLIYWIGLYTDYISYLFLKSFSALPTLSLLTSTSKISAEETIQYPIQLLQYYRAVYYNSNNF